MRDFLSPADIARDEMLAQGFVVVEEDEDVAVVSDVKVERVRWLWKQRLPLGKVVLLDGDPGLGKSTLTIDVTARLTTGRTLPDDEVPAPPQNVLLVSAEDGAGDTIRPRLEAAGADLDRVFLFDRVRDYDERNDSYFVRPVEFPKDLPRLRGIVERYDTSLAILDPLVAFLDARTDSHRDQDVRRILYPLAQIAESTSTTILCLRHLNKNPGTNPLYRGGGSIGFVGAARLALLVAAHPEDDERRVLAVSKSNLAKLPDSLVFRLYPDDFHGVAYVGWEAGSSSLRATDLLGGERRERGRPPVERSAAEDFLCELLEEGPVRATVVRDRADDEGIAFRTLKRAKRSLDVRSFRRSGEWYWEFEDASDETAPENEESKRAITSGPLGAEGKDARSPSNTGIGTLTPGTPEIGGSLLEPDSHCGALTGSPNGVSPVDPPRKEGLRLADDSRKGDDDEHCE